MTSLARQKISCKLESLKEYRGYLQQLREEVDSEEQFVADFHLFGNTERYLQLSIQAIIDSTHLVIIDLDLARPDDNYEAISILHEQHVITGALAQTLTKMVGLRNILVHEYGRIDRKRIYTVLTTQIRDLEEFQKQLLTYLAK